MKVTIGNYRPPNSKAERKINVEVHPWDTYSLYHTMALVIHPLLVAYKNDIVERDAGVPSDFLPAIDVSGLSEEEAQKVHEEHWTKALDEWLSILDKMIWSFQQCMEDYAGEEDFFSVREVPVNPDDPFGRFDIDQNGLNDYYEKIDEGLKLFARYYRSLWW
jgi:hypothetical protein